VSAPASYRFGQIEVRPAERRILVNGQSVSVGARAFDLLVMLITHRHRVVSKDELLDSVWPGVIVEENNLQVHVSGLRKILGNQAIATVPGHGYRLTLAPDNIEAVNDAPRARKQRHNLPASLTSFVGREREMRELITLLASSRLVTLTSMGGTGKTRLSLQLGAEIADNYADGVWLVELAALTDARLVPAAVAAVLGVMEVSGRSVMEALEQFVKDRQLLVIFDNCEHLVEAAAMVAKKLLQAGRGVQVLASSRERLQVLGETTYVVPSLCVPTLIDSQSNTINFSDAVLAEFSHNEAVRLWLDRARAVEPQFQVTAKNAAAIADICRRLDGIPLAIELAAARMYAMSVEHIAAQLHDRFSLLTGGDRTAMPRQQTLRASIDWSVDMLGSEERALFLKLSVFAGGWTLPAVAALVNGKPSDVTAHLIQLVEKSLVIKDADNERYRLLETVREYAHEQLQLQGEADNAKRVHINFYLALAEIARPQLAGAKQGEWLAKLDAERENLLAAHTHAGVMVDGAPLGLSLAWALKPYWITRGYLGLGLQLTLEALSHPSAVERNLARCRGRCDAGWLCVLMGKNDVARLNLEESYAIALELDDMKRVAIALQPLGLAAMGQGDLTSARAYLKQAITLAQTIGNPREIAAANSVYGQFLRVVGELDAAEPLYAESLAIARDLQDPEYIAISLLNLAMVFIERQHGERVPIMLLEALTTAEDIGSKRIGQSIVDVAIGLAALNGDWHNAARYVGVAVTLAIVTGLQRDAADEAFLTPRLLQIQSALTATEYALALAAGSAFTYSEMTAALRAWLIINQHRV
jgi:predicted ATPase/DNA-binding winged helix-turn-helix (wHTH) protein